MQDRAYVHEHGFAAAVEINHLQIRTPAVGRSDVPVGRGLFPVGEKVGKPAGQVTPLHGEAFPAQCFLHRVFRGQHARLPVGDQVYVPCEPVDNSVGDQGVAAAERESEPGGGTQRDRGDATVQRVERHQATSAFPATAANSG